MALRDLSRAPLALGNDDIQLLQAPTKIRFGLRRIESPLTFAHVLYNVGFGEADELRSMVAAWRSLYCWQRPDLIVFDHSPTALLAAGAEPSKRIVLGTGFFTPPDRAPMPQLRPLTSEIDDKLFRIESDLLRTVNSVRRQMSLPSWERLAQLYGDVHENILTTFRELDPYLRHETNYWGIGPSLSKLTPHWPSGIGKKIFAYLRPFPGLGGLLKFLSQSCQPTLVYGRGIDMQLQALYSSETLRFVNEPLDLTKVCNQCDLAILNGSHTTTAAMLLAGKPVMQIPVTGEQFLIANNTKRLGCGLVSPGTDADTIVSTLEYMLGTDEFRRTAIRVAARYDGFDPMDQVKQVAGQIERVLATMPATR